MEQKGLSSIIPELREYSKENMLTFIEWAEFAYDEIPVTSLRINVEYDKDDIDIRRFEFSDINNKNAEFLNNFSKRISK